MAYFRQVVLSTNANSVFNVDDIEGKGTTVKGNERTSSSDSSEEEEIEPVKEAVEEGYESSSNSEYADEGENTNEENKD